MKFLFPLPLLLLLLLLLLLAASTIYTHCYYPHAIHRRGTQTQHCSQTATVGPPTVHKTRHLHRWLHLTKKPRPERTGQETTTTAGRKRPEPQERQTYRHSRNTRGTTGHQIHRKRTQTVRVGEQDSFPCPKAERGLRTRCRPLEEITHTSTRLRRRHRRPLGVLTTAQSYIVRNHHQYTNFFFTIFSPHLIDPPTCCTEHPLPSTQ